MTQKHMNELMDVMMNDINKMRNEGQKEYAHDSSEIFANFNRVSHLLEESRQKVLMTYMLKHIDGISAYVKGHKSQREDVRGRITDSIVYLMLLRGMIEEDEHNDTLSREKANTQMHNVRSGLEDENGCISLEGASITSYGIHPNGDLQEMCEERNGIQETGSVETAS